MAKKFDAAAAYAADPDDDSMGQDSASAPSADPNATPADSSQGDGQPLNIPPDQVAQMEQLKQTGDFAALGQLVAQLLP